MFVVWTVEGHAYSLGQLVGSEQTIGFYHPPFAVNPFGLYRVEPRALFGQKAANDSYSMSTVFDPLVVRAYPGAHLFGCVPACVVPDQHPNLLAHPSELLGAPRQKTSRYGAHRVPIHDPGPHLLKLWHKESVAGDGLGIRIILGERLLHQTQGLFCIAPTRQRGLPQAAPPGLVAETHNPIIVAACKTDQPVAPPFFLS